LRMVNRDRPVAGDLRFAGSETRGAQSATLTAAAPGNELAKSKNQRMIAA